MAVTVVSGWPFWGIEAPYPRFPAMRPQREGPTLRHRCHDRLTGPQTFQGPSAGPAEDVIVGRLGVAARAERETAALAYRAAGLDDQVLPVASVGIEPRRSLVHDEVDDRGARPGTVVRVNEDGARGERPGWAERGVSLRRFVRQDLRLEVAVQVLRDSARRRLSERRDRARELPDAA